MVSMAARASAALLLLLAGPASCLESPDDFAGATSLLQHSVKVRPAGPRAAGNGTSASCQCLGWKDAYALHGAQCGLGHEVDVYGRPGAETVKDLSVAFEFCWMYFNALPNDNYCMNVKWEPAPAQWCYVSQDCPEGQTPEGSGPLKTKTCVQGHDASLGEMKFEDFAAYIYRNKLELGLSVQFAYPTWQPEKLPDVQAFWGLPQPSDAQPISEELRARLQQQVDSGKPMFFTSRSGHPPYCLMEGKKLYYINFNPDNPGFAKREDMSLFACVAGCGAENKPIW